MASQGTRRFAAEAAVVESLPLGEAERQGFAGRQSSTKGFEPKRTAGAQSLTASIASSCVYLRLGARHDQSVRSLRRFPAESPLRRVCTPALLGPSEKLEFPKDPWLLAGPFWGLRLPEEPPSLPFGGLGLPEEPPPLESFLRGGESSPSSSSSSVSLSRGERSSFMRCFNFSPISTTNP